MKAPSTSLLRAFLRPTECACQIRASSTFMPRDRYAKVTSLDKLHRRQKEAVRKERQDSQLRALAMQPPSIVSQSSSTESLSSPDFLDSENPTTSLPYSIPRTKSNNLPVYETSKAGGNKHITVVRKLSGDLTTLQTHIREALNLSESFVDRLGRKKINVTINQTTRQIVVRGWRGPEIKKWAEMVGF